MMRGSKHPKKCGSEKGAEYISVLLNNIDIHVSSDIAKGFIGVGELGSKAWQQNCVIEKTLSLSTVIRYLV